MADHVFPAMMAFMPVYMPVVPFQHESELQPAGNHDASPENAPERLSDAPSENSAVFEKCGKEILLKVYASDTWVRYEEGLWLRATHLKLFDDS